MRKRDAAAGGATFAAYTGIGLVSIAIFFVLYEVVVLRDTFLGVAREHELRKEFSEIPNVDRYYFVQEEIQESRQIVDRGIFVSSFRKWWEEGYLYKLVTLDSIYLKVAVFLILCLVVVVFGYMFFQYKSNTYWFERAIDVRKSEADRMQEMMMATAGGKQLKPKRAYGKNHLQIAS